MPMPINIFHRNTLHQFHRKLHQLMDIEHKNNFCIIIDETQIATKVDMTIHKIFKQLGGDQLDLPKTSSSLLHGYTDSVYFDLPS